MMEKIIVRDYPLPDPVTGSPSRFAVAEKTTGENGQETTTWKPAAAEPACPVAEFKYDATTGKGWFEDKIENKLPVKEKPKKIPPYIPGDDLIELVRLAQILQRPVLIKGEPGSGKTQLAKAVAYEWYGDEYKKHFFEWQVKSTSKAVDGLYTFDHIARLRDANLPRPQTAGTAPADTGKKEDLSRYRTFGPMGRAFLTSTPEQPSILLIDEIDKADIDFPNDLLLELDERRFTIPDSETGEKIEAGYPPLIFITSNDERELPEAFLRRCLFLYIKFPDDGQLHRIIEAHMPDFAKGYEELINKAITRFHQLREEIKNDPSDNKRVSTSEMLDWLTALYYNLDGKDAPQDLEHLPYPQTLLKSYPAVNRRQQAIDKDSSTAKK